jgi:hypothetical protein
MVSSIPCVFRGSFIREQVDPRIKDAWPGRAPWGDLRKTWKQEYCRRVNPTGAPEDCPFPEEDCAMTFLQTVLSVIGSDRPGAAFRARAKTKGAVRADQRPLARDRVPARRPDDLGSERERTFLRVMAATRGPEVDVPRGRTRPTSVGEVLRALDLGARQVRPPDGEEGMGR